MSDMASKRSSRKQQAWLYTIAVLFCADFVFYGYMPSHKRLQSLREAEFQQKRMIETAAAQSKELPALTIRLNNVEQIVDHYESYVPQEESSGVFLQEIARIMTEHDLADQVVVPGREVESEGIRCIPVRIDCKGNLKDIFSFFRAFQAMDRLVRIQKVTLQNDRDFTGNVNMDTQAVIFYRPQATQDVKSVAASL
jgi:Tfp pilus assembly protein PilO